jgi:hypothetical protein
LKFILKVGFIINFLRFETILGKSKYYLFVSLALPFIPTFGEGIRGSLKFKILNRQKTENNILPLKNHV